MDQPDITTERSNKYRTCRSTGERTGKGNQMTAQRFQTRDVWDISGLPFGGGGGGEDVINRHRLQCCPGIGWDSYVKTNSSLILIKSQRPEWVQKLCESHSRWSSRWAGSPSLIGLTVSVDVKQHWKKKKKSLIAHHLDPSLRLDVAMRVAPAVVTSAAAHHESLRHRQPCCPYSLQGGHGPRPHAGDRRHTHHLGRQTRYCQYIRGGHHCRHSSHHSCHSRHCGWNWGVHRWFSKAAADR